jgi:ACS family sodium-dependent inorganic phosphate cotransporter
VRGVQPTQTDRQLLIKTNLQRPGMFASAAALMVMPSATSVGGGVALTSLTLAALGFARGGFSVNHMDIAPKYAGVVMGLSNTAGGWVGCVGVWGGRWGIG